MNNSDDKADASARVSALPGGRPRSGVQEKRALPPRPAPRVSEPEDPPIELPVEAAEPARASIDAAVEAQAEPPEEDVEIDEDADAYIGTTVGDRYLVDAIIGEGGMGRVYLAHHKVIGKKVAIKILHQELAKDKEAVGRFVREAQAASSVGNAHIVDISDFGEMPDGSTYFVMEYLDGIALSDLMEERGALPPQLVCDVALQLCDGLAAAHRQAIVHRDLKPDNITLVAQGKSDHFCKILDFGIAKVSTSTSSTKLTMAGAVFGTPHYMSPEQAAGASIDHRTDVYSLGVMLYEMVSGKLPFHADNFMGILTQHMYKAPVPINNLVGAPECPRGLEAIILKCLSKKQDARYRSMEELAQDIAKFLADGMPEAVHEMMARSGSFNVPADYFKGGAAMLPASPRGPRPRLGPRYVALAGVIVAVGAVLFVIMRDSTTTAHPAPEPAPRALPEPMAAPAEPSAPAGEAPKRAVDVLLYAVPADATAMRDGKPIQLPETFAVRAGEIVELEISAPGHESETIALDGSKPKVGVELKRKTPRTGVRFQPPPKSGKPKGGTVSDVHNPWNE
jgi:serine/threonine-protein kinase